MQAFQIEDSDDNYNYNMDPAFDSFSQSASDRCTGPNSLLNISILPSPTSPTHPIAVPVCNPQISLTHRPIPRRSASARFDNAHTEACFSHTAQAPADNLKIASILTSPQSAYISPPNTDSRLDRAHPLPSTFDIGRSSLIFTVAAEGTFGILDSPLVMRREDLRSSPEKPLSPPLTLPLSTLTLPDADNEFCSGDHDGSEQSTQEAHGESQVGVRKDTLSDENEETLSDLLRSEGADLSKLSPLSPSWKSDMSVIPENSALLGSFSLATRRSRNSLTADRERDRMQPYNKRNRPGSYLNHDTAYDASTSPPWSADGPLPIVVGDEEGSAHLERIDDAFVSYMPTPLATPRRSSTSSGSSVRSSSYGSDSLPTPTSPGNLSFDGMSDLWSLRSRLSHDFDCDRPFLPPLDIPESSYHTHTHKHAPANPDMFIPKLFDDDYSMEVDHEKSPPPAVPMSFPSPYETDPSPNLSPSSFTLSPSILPSYIEPLPPPSSPSISRLSLPDLDIDLNDDESHPSSPSRRSFASLPDLEMDDITDIEVDFSAPVPLPSPRQTLLSLPGADTDEDLLPPPAPNFKTPAPPPHPSSPSLLFIDDPRDVPLPRSPSPEDFDIDLNIVLDDESDPELTKLYNLHKKSLAAERAARHAEAQLIDAGSISLRAEATREKKKNKQTSKEVGALLRLKLGDQIAYPSSASVDGHPKGLMSSMSQLVARMMFRRHEAFRPLANRKSAFTSHDYTRSSLSQSSVVDFSGVDFS